MHSIQAKCHCVSFGSEWDRARLAMQSFLRSWRRHGEDNYIYGGGCDKNVKEGAFPFYLENHFNLGKQNYYIM